LRETDEYSRRSKYLSHMQSFKDASEVGELDIVKAIVKAMVEITGFGGEGWDCISPPHDATHNGNLPVVQYMCEQGAGKEARDEDDWTPLHRAARYGHLPVMQYMCERGADKEARDQDDWTPLHWAAEDGHLPVMQYLSE